MLKVKTFIEELVESIKVKLVLVVVLVASCQATIFVKQ